MKLTDKLNSLIKDAGYTRKRFSDAVGIPYSTIDNWYKRGYENMSITTLKTLCAFFSVKMESMAYDDREIEYEPRDASPFRDYARDDDEQTLLRGYRVAGSETRGNLLLLANGALDAQKEKDAEKLSGFQDANNLAG